MPDIEELIRRAIEEGKFADLPGRGKPLHLDENPHTDPEWRLAYHLLRQNGFSLPWLEQRREIEIEYEQACQRLQTAWELRARALQGENALETAEAAWQRSLAEFHTRFARLNRRIFDYNLQTPSARFQMLPLDPEKEIQRIRDSGGG